MDLWHLKVFQKVIEMKGFSNASRMVNLTQPTISSHIKEMENYYGCRLIGPAGQADPAHPCRDAAL
ncbi:MAG: LysR family transcriptional regulator [Desulfobacterales bacterium]